MNNEPKASHSSSGYGGIYKKEKHNFLKYNFDSSELIETNFSQAYQDMFVLSMLNGKKNGIFVEIGASQAIIMSNTYLLESQYGWNGLSIDIDDNSKKSFEDNNRASKFVLGDATALEYQFIFEKHNLPKQIDYLQLDIEPQHQTLKCLKKLPLDKYRFSVITFETDVYNNSNNDAIFVRNESRKILLSYGYELIIGDVSNVGNDPFEDWYVDPKVINNEIINIFKSSDSSNMTSENYMLSK